MPRIMIEIEGEEAIYLMEQINEIKQRLEECTTFIQELKEHQVLDKLKEATP